MHGGFGSGDCFQKIHILEPGWDPHPISTPSKLQTSRSPGSHTHIPEPSIMSIPVPISVDWLIQFSKEAQLPGNTTRHVWPSLPQPVKQRKELSIEKLLQALRVSLARGSSILRSNQLSFLWLVFVGSVFSKGLTMAMMRECYTDCEIGIEI